MPQSRKIAAVSAPASATEVGCGEGWLEKRGYKVDKNASDAFDRVIREQNERYRDNHEGDEDDGVALRKGRAAREHLGQCKRCRERHDAAHAAPAHDHEFAFGGRGLA